MPCRSVPCGLWQQKSCRSKNVVICHQNWSICMIPSQKLDTHKTAPVKALQSVYGLLRNPSGRNGIQEVVGSIPISSTILFSSVTNVKFTVYVLRSEIWGSSYVGHTSDITKRLIEHNSGKSISTRSKKPWRLVYQEEFQSRAEAMAREKYFKSQSGGIQLKSMGFI